MAYLIKGAHVFAPEDLGVVDVLTVNDKVVAVGKDLSASLPELETIDAKGLVMTPGFIDQHIHVTGGGGEGGPKTRTPELVLSELVACGTTSVVGVSGTDGTSRSIPNLLGKVRALQAEGVSAWMYTSNYAYPPTTLTSCVRDDLYFVPEVLGVKIAMGDHRSSFPTEDEVMRLLTQIRVGAMVAGKLGVLHIHLGNIVGPFDMFLDCVKRGMPIQHIRPTHCARHPDVFKGAIEFGLAGGYVDITTGGSCAVGTPAAGVKAVLDAGVPLYAELRRPRLDAALQRSGRNGGPRRGRRRVQPEGSEAPRSGNERPDDDGSFGRHGERREGSAAPGQGLRQGGRLGRPQPLRRRPQARSRLRERPSDDARRRNHREGNVRGIIPVRTFV